MATKMNCGCSRSMALCIQDDGRSGKPLTSVGQAALMNDGQYVFDIGDVQFTAPVTGGKVVIAEDVVGGSSLTQTNNLIIGSDGILPGDEMALLAATASNAHILTPQSGTIDSSTTDQNVINHIINYEPIHSGLSDNAINSSWVGAGSSYLTEPAVTQSSAGTDLDDVIFHTSNATNGTHWIPSSGYHRPDYTAVDEEFRLLLSADPEPRNAFYLYNSTTDLYELEGFPGQTLTHKQLSNMGATTCAYPPIPEPFEGRAGQAIIDMSSVSGNVIGGRRVNNFDLGHGSSINPGSQFKSNGQFIADRDQTAMFTADISRVTAEQSDLRMNILVNGVSKGNVFFSGSDSYETDNGTRVIDLKKGDVVTWEWVGSGSSRVGTSTSTRMSYGEFSPNG